MLFELLKTLKESKKLLYKMPEPTYVYKPSPRPSKYKRPCDGRRQEDFLCDRLLRDALGLKGTKQQIKTFLDAHPQNALEFKGTSEQSIESLLNGHLNKLKKIGAIGVLPATSTQETVIVGTDVTQETVATPQQSFAQSYYQRQKAEHEALKAKYETLIVEHQALKTALEAVKAENDALKTENLALNAKIGNSLSAKLIVSDLESRLQILRALI